MACEYCRENSVLMKVEVPYVIWGNEVAGYHELGVMYDDRGYIRLASLDDCNCLDHGEKIKMHYCFNCGRKIVEDK